MSILLETPHALLIDLARGFSTAGFVLNTAEFEVTVPYSASLPKKRKRDSSTDATCEHGDENNEAVTTGQFDEDYHSMMREIIALGLREIREGWNAEYRVRTGNEVVYDDKENMDFVGLISMVDSMRRNAMLEVNEGETILNEDTELETTEIFHRLITNSTRTTLNLSYAGSKYLIPPGSTFLLSDIADIKILAKHAERHGYFDLIVLDPPWPNKSISRSSAYMPIDAYDLHKIPIRRLLNPSGTGTIAVWCTNKPKFRRLVVEKLFPIWGVRLIEEMCWLKVTIQGEPVVNLESPHRKPYERLIIGKMGIKSEVEVEKRVMVGVPSHNHSRKPPLHEILATHLPNTPRCLELFARNLLPGWTSWGNEVLKFQNKKMFFANEEDK
ncbi:uncharacterized protein VTP21DRAFT_11230 [Calcarisporiella thermophila]|uniref:uncharacterized protein n=1 Tax=Calcarisporiella thermophila TaxID=911321 RepID=UPI00374317F5